MTRSLSVLSKILGLTASSNVHEARLAEEKLEQQLQARGITREQLEQQLDMESHISVLIPLQLLFLVRLQDFTMAL